MNYHIDYNPSCGECGCQYIPFDKKEPCPKCGVVAFERFDFIPEAAQIVHFNFKETGTYIPETLAENSLLDRALTLLFKILEYCRKDESGRPFSEVTEEFLKKVHWDGEDYYRGYFQKMATLIRDDLNYLESSVSKIENLECGGCS